MVRDKQFYRTFFGIFAVLVLQNIITLSVNLLDNIMLGAYSETALAGVAAVNQIQFVYQQILGGVGEGVVILGTQYYGGHKLKPIKVLTATAMRFALVFCAVLFIFVSLFPHQALTFFTTDSPIIEEGTRYLMLVRFSYLFFAITQILLASLRSTGVVRIGLCLSVAAFGINGIINYALIFGHFGAPEMGVAGAAIGTLIARIAELCFLLAYLIMYDKKRHYLHFCLKDFLQRDHTLFLDYMRVMLPVLLVSGLWGFNNAVQNAILGHMQANAIAANSVASTLFLMVKSSAVGASSAAGFLIGRTIGEGNKAKLLQYSRTVQMLFVIIGICSALLLFGIRIPILELYNLTPNTLSLANTFLIILSVVCAFMSYQMPVNTGIIRAGGDTRYVMVLDLISIWGIVIPLSLLMAFVVKASPVVVICCLNADQVFKCVPAFIKCNYCHWAKKLTR